MKNNKDLKFPCEQHTVYIPGHCKDCEQGVTEELEYMIEDLEAELKSRKIK